MEQIGYPECTNNDSTTTRGPSSPCCSGGDDRLSAAAAGAAVTGGCCGGSKVTTAISITNEKQELSLAEAAAQLPFAAAGMEVEQQDDLGVLADLPGSDETDVAGAGSSSANAKCAFRLDGKPCKLCNEDEGEEEDSSCNGSRCSEEGDSQVKEELGPSPNFLVPLVLLAANVAERKEELQKKNDSCCDSSSGCKGNTTATAPTSSCSSQQQQQQQVKKAPEEEIPMDAYERKKVKQKNVRVQLNRALDRLGSAMQRATEQSIVRATQLQQQQHQRSPPQGFELDDSSSVLVEPLRTTLSLPEGGQNCHRIDRPSLVGAAADMLNDMNNQCQTLALEVLRLRQQLNNNKVNSNNTKNQNGHGTSTTCCNSKRKRKHEEIQTKAPLESNIIF